VYKELAPMKKDQSGSGKCGSLDPDSKTRTVSGRPLTARLRCRAFQTKSELRVLAVYLFPERQEPIRAPATLKTVWHKTLRRAKIRIFDLRSPFDVRNPASAGGRGDEWVTQLLRQATRRSSRNTRR